MALTRWQPLRDLLSFQDEMNRMFNRFFDTTLSEERERTGINWYPAIDVSEKDKEFVVYAELPGLKKDDIHLRYSNGALTIEGEREREKEEKDKKFHRVERAYGKFSRTFEVPAVIQSDKITANFKDGVLEIHLPKVEEETPKRIEIKTS